MSEVKLFKRQSQQMRAVRLEANQLLDELADLLERAKTEPPPTAPSYVDEYNDYNQSKRSA